MKKIRHFSTAFKKEKVDLIKKRKLKVKDVSDVYGVSKGAVYKWLHKYGNIPKGERIVVEKTSEEAKNIDLLKRIKDLESEIGRMHIENILLSKVIDCGSELLGEDLKKKFTTRQFK